MYYWSHTEAVNAAPPTPGRLTTVAWPPPLSPNASQEAMLQYNGSQSNLSGEYILYIENCTSLICLI